MGLTKSKIKPKHTITKNAIKIYYFENIIKQYYDFCIKNNILILAPEYTKLYYYMKINKDLHNIFYGDQENIELYKYLIKTGYYDEIQNSEKLLNFVKHSRTFRHIHIHIKN